MRKNPSGTGRPRNRMQNFTPLTRRVDCAVYICELISRGVSPAESPAAETRRACIIIIIIFSAEPIETELIRPRFASVCFRTPRNVIIALHARRGSTRASAGLSSGSRISTPDGPSPRLPGRG